MGALDCLVCTNKFDLTDRRPRSLTCGHTLCSICLFEMFRIGPLSCPVCRTDHGSEVFCVEDLPINYIVLDLIRECSLPSLTSSDVMRSLKDEASNTISTRLMDFKEQYKFVSDLKSKIDIQKRAHDGVKNSVTMLPDHLDTIFSHLEEETTYLEEVLQQGPGRHKALMDAKERLETASTLLEVSAAHQQVTECDNSMQHWIQTVQLLKNRKVLERAKQVHSLTQKLVMEVWAKMAATKPPALLPLKAQILCEPVSVAGLEAALCQNSVWAVNSNQNGHPCRARISQHGRHLLLHCLQDGVAPSSASTVQYESVRANMTVDTAFLSLQWDGEIKGKLYIKLENTRDSARQFLHLCAGDKGHSYCGTRFFERESLCLGGNDWGCYRFWGGDYEHNNGEGGQALPGMSCEDVELSVVTRGLVVAGVDGRWERKPAQFAIHTSGTYKCFTCCPIGNVVEGLDLIDAADAVEDIKSVSVADCGLVLRW